MRKKFKGMQKIKIFLLYITGKHILSTQLLSVNNDYSILFVDKIIIYDIVFIILSTFTESKLPKHIYLYYYYLTYG